MKFYSEKTKKIYDTEEALVSAEKELETAEAKKKELLDKRKERAQEVEQAFEKANKLLSEFLNDYGRYHTTITPERNWFDILFDLW